MHHQQEAVFLSGGKPDTIPRPQGQLFRGVVHKHLPEIHSNVVLCQHPQTDKLVFGVLKENCHCETSPLKWSWQSPG